MREIHYAMKLYVKTFGCQMNVHDSERIEGIFREAGYEITQDPKAADVALVNSCTVREKAWHKAISETGRLRKVKRGNSRVVVGLVGCVAQQEGERIFDLIPGVDLVVSPDKYGSLIELVEEIRSEGSPMARVGFDNGEETDFLSLGPVVQSGATAFVTIMKGCKERCAYCIVPSVRGPERFRPTDQIIEEARQLVARGVKEITLLGQKVNAYSKDGVEFHHLLEQLDSVDGLARLRFTSPHPRHMTMEVIAAFGELPSLCESIHLPVQAGSDAVLERMGRRYTKARYLEIVEGLRAARPDIAISTDLIVGYPGETEADFLETLDLIDRACFSSAFSFKYSPRPGTRAARIEDDVPDEEKAARLSAVHERIEALERRWRRSQVGRVLQVLVENQGRNEGQVGGRAGNNQIVNFVPEPGNTFDELKGRLVSVEITQAHPHSLEGMPAR